MQSAEAISRDLSRSLMRSAGAGGPPSHGAKRAFDLFGSLILLLFLAPVFLLIAIGVGCSGGRVFFGHERVGRDGRKFRCLKFRSMYPDAEARLQRLLERDAEARAEWFANFKLKNDPRVTPIGAALRRSSLDELPQLLNVLAGDMCLVGPAAGSGRRVGALWPVRAVLFIDSARHDRPLAGEWA